MTNEDKVVRNSIDMGLGLQFLFDMHPELREYKVLQELVQNAQEWQSSFNAYVKGGF